LRSRGTGAGLDHRVVSAMVSFRERVKDGRRLVREVIAVHDYVEAPEAPRDWWLPIDWP
jgi:hypothetical protein